MPQTTSKLDRSQQRKTVTNRRGQSVEVEIERIHTGFHGKGRIHHILTEDETGQLFSSCVNHRGEWIGREMSRSSYSYGYFVPIDMTKGQRIQRRIEEIRRINRQVRFCQHCLRANKIGKELWYA